MGEPVDSQSEIMLLQHVGERVLELSEAGVLCKLDRREANLLLLEFLSSKVLQNDCV
jgi:hypothetical protein